MKKSVLLFSAVTMLTLVPSLLWAREDWSRSSVYGQIDPLSRGVQTSSSSGTTTGGSAEGRISNNLEIVFNRIQQIGSAYNDQGGNGAMRAALSALCDYGVSEINTLVNPSSSQFGRNLTSGNTGDFSSTVANRLLTGGVEAGVSYAQAACMGLVDGRGLGGTFDYSNLQDGAISALAEVGQAWARQSKLPFLSRMEASVGLRDGDPYLSVLTIQPLWSDKEHGRYTFNQTSLNRHAGDIILNSGFVVRQLIDSDTVMIGANIFFDHTFKEGHNRISIGVDADTAYYGISANRYIPISDWRSVGAIYEERPMPGWDLRIEGRLPQLPTWDGYLRGFTWESFGRENNDIYGVEAGVEWSPVPMMTFSGSVSDDNESKLEGRVALTFNYQFGHDLRPTEPNIPNSLSMANRVYQRVERENTVKVERRRKASTYLSVVETSGVNSASDENGTKSLSVGLELSMPASVVVANTVGAHARLSFSDGAILTIGQGSSVTIDLDRVTLTSAGTMQYVSGHITRTVSVPGGTINLLGTDIDVVSNGTTTTTRVRDGLIHVTGQVAGELNMSVGEMSQIVSGVVNPVTTGSATYLSHAAAIVSEIDWVADPQTGVKVAPYVPTAPAVVTEALAPGQVITFGLSFNQAVTVSGGTPLLNLTVGGITRTATLLSGSGTDQLLFGYTLQPADAGATTISINNVDVNGATINGGSKDAITDIVPTTVTLSGAVGDVTAPSGYSVVFAPTSIDAAHASSAGFTFSGAEVGTTYNYTITDSASHTVTGSGTVSSATQNVSGINLSGMNDGTLTLSVTLTDSSSNVGTAATATATKDIGAPSGYTVAFSSATINAAAATGTSFSFTGAETGSTYNYTVTDGASHSVTGTGTIASATQTVSGVNVSTLDDGTLTLSVTLTDSVGNTGSASTATATKDVAAPTGYSVAFTTSPVDAAHASSAAFTLSGAEVGAAYSYTISDAASHTVTGSGTVATVSQAFTGLDLSTLNDGALTLSLTLTDTAGNAGAAAVGTVSKDTGAPASYTVAFTSATISAAQSTATSFSFTGAEIGTTYNYTISDGASHTATGSGTISSATQTVGSINVSGLNDGTLSLSVTLTDAASNVGAAATATATKDSGTPSGYTVAFTPSIVGSGNVASIGFSFAGAEIGTTYNYTISDAASHTVTGSSTISSATQAVNSINVSGLNDGTLTLSATLTDGSGNIGSAATATVTKDTVAPSGYSVAFNPASLNTSGATAAGFTFTAAEVGATYSYTFSDGASHTVTNTGTVSSATETISGIDLSSLNDGAISLSVTLTDPAGNTGTAATASSSKDVSTPSGYSVAFVPSYINSGNVTMGSFSFTAAEVGTTYSYTISDTASHSVTATGTIATATDTISPVDLTTLTDGTLTLSVTLSDSVGNAGSAATATITKDIVAPTITSVTAPADDTYGP